jgi:Chaperone of endosialidase
MNPLIQLKTTIPPLLAFVFACFALSPVSRAVVPPPDGGYPGGNTAEGTEALNSVVILHGRGEGPGGVRNTAIGYQTLFSDILGHNNTATGYHALFSNTSGARNAAIGSQALNNNVDSSDSTAVGFNALYSQTFGERNTAIGSYALFNSTFNPPLYYGHDNTAVGFQALYNNIEGAYNIALGTHAGAAQTYFSYWNIDIGNEGVDGEANTIRIGTPPQPDGWFEPGHGGPSGQSRTFIAGIRDVNTGNDDAIPVVIDSAGQLGTGSSSRRFKTEIKPMEKISEAVLALKPVTFRYKGENSNNSSRRQFGLIAEEVAKVNPDLIVRDENGEIYTVRYDAVNAMLLNEFLKGHHQVQEQGRKLETQDRKVQQQEATIAKQQKQIEALTAGLQKVSAQLEASKPAQQVVNNP